MEIRGMVGGMKHWDGERDCSKPCMFLQGAGCRLTGGDAACVQAPEPDEPCEFEQRYRFGRWSDWETSIAMDATLYDDEVARIVGRSRNAVRQKRIALRSSR